MSLSLALAINPSGGTTSSAAFVATLTFTFAGDAPTGTLTLIVNGNPSTEPTAVTDSPQQVPVNLVSPVPGAYSIQFQYSGDSDYPGTVDSNTVTYTVAGTVPPVTPSVQAQAKAVSAFTLGTALTRTERENGQYQPEGYKVTAIAVLVTGSGRYDVNTVGTLTGNVAGVFTRQDLTLTLNDTAGIASMTGFDGATLWDQPPQVNITRWDAPGDAANFLGT